MRGSRKEPRTLKIHEAVLKTLKRTQVRRNQAAFRLQKVTTVCKALNRGINTQKERLHKKDLLNKPPETARAGKNWPRTLKTSKTVLGHKNESKSQIKYTTGQITGAGEVKTVGQT